MSSLVSSYLTTERLLLVACSPDLGWHDLAGVCRLAVEDLPEPARTGLGLCIGRSIVERHNGTLSVDGNAR